MVITLGVLTALGLIYVILGGMYVLQALIDQFTNRGPVTIAESLSSDIRKCTPGDIEYCTPGGW